MRPRARADPGQRLDGLSYIQIEDFAAPEKSQRYQSHKQAVVSAGTVEISLAQENRLIRDAPAAPAFGAIASGDQARGQLVYVLQSSALPIPDQIK